jgi:hypothetical protein
MILTSAPRFDRDDPRLGVDSDDEDAAYSADWNPHRFSALLRLLLDVWHALVPPKMLPPADVVESLQAQLAAHEVDGATCRDPGTAAEWCAACTRLSKPGEAFVDHPLFALRLCGKCAEGDAGRLAMELDQEGLDDRGCRVCGSADLPVYCCEEEACTAMICMNCIQLHGAGCGERDFAVADATPDAAFICWLCRPQPPPGCFDLVRRGQLVELRRVQAVPPRKPERKGQKGRMKATRAKGKGKGRKPTALNQRGGFDTNLVFKEHGALPAPPPFPVGGGRAPYVLLENVATGMTDEECATVQAKLGLDWLFLDSTVFSVFRRQRYYFCNFPSLAEDTLPRRDDSPKFDAVFEPDRDGRALEKGAWNCQHDGRFLTDAAGLPAKPEKYLKLLCMLPRIDKRALQNLNGSLDEKRPLTKEDVTTAKLNQFVPYTQPATSRQAAYSRLRHLSVAEVEGEHRMGFPDENGELGGRGPPWTRKVENEQKKYDMLGNSVRLRAHTLSRRAPGATSQRSTIAL